MLKREFHEQHEDGTIFYTLYSTENNYILQQETNTLYDEVCITDNDTHTYIETDIPIEEEKTETELKAEAYDIITGEVDYE